MHAHMKKRTRVTPDTVRLRPSANFSEDTYIRYDQNVGRYYSVSHDTLIIAPQQSSLSSPQHHSSRPCVPSPQETPLEQLSSVSVQLPYPVVRLPQAYSAPRPVIS